MDDTDMTALMLTALDSSTNALLDLTALDRDGIDELHGARTARRHGHDPICRHCHQAVHLVLNHHRTTFWRHNPGTSTRCLLAEVAPGGESTEHVAAKAAIVGTIRRLRGWHAEPEHRFEAGGDLVIADVYAHHDRPAAHQASTLWEVQLSHQTHGTFVERSQRAQTISGHRAAWVTPHDQALGDQLGIVTDPTAQLVVARIYTAPDEREAMPPMSLQRFVLDTARHRAPLLWSQSGYDDRWIVFPRDSASGSQPSPSRPPQQQAPDRPHIDRAGCDRTPPQPDPATARVAFVMAELRRVDDERIRGRARVAAARRHAGLHLDPGDLDALARYPDPTPSTTPHTASRTPERSPT